MGIHDDREQEVKAELKQISTTPSTQKNSSKNSELGNVICMALTLLTGTIATVFTFVASNDLNALYAIVAIGLQFLVLLKTKGYTSVKLTVLAIFLNSLTAGAGVYFQNASALYGLFATFLFMLFAKAAE